MSKHRYNPKLFSGNDEEGGGFPLPSFIRAIMEVVLDRDEPVLIGELVERVGRADANSQRVRMVFESDDLEQARLRQTEAVVRELEHKGYVEYSHGYVSLASGFEEVAERTERGGWVVEVGPKGSPERAKVYAREEREERDRVLEGASHVKALLPELAKPKITSKESADRLASLEASMAVEGYDPRWPIIRYVGPDGEPVTVAGHHREHAAITTGTEPAYEDIDDPIEAVKAAFRSNEGRSWSTAELKKFHRILRDPEMANGGGVVSQARVAELLGVSQKTISIWERDGVIPRYNARRDSLGRRNTGRPRGALKDSPGAVEWVATQLTQGLTRDEIVKASKSDDAWPVEGRSLSNGSFDTLKAVAEERGLLLAPPELIPLEPEAQVELTTTHTHHTQPMTDESNEHKPMLCTRCGGTGIEPGEEQ